MAARTNAQRDAMIDDLIARVAELESQFATAEPVADAEPDAPAKKVPAIAPNSRQVERMRLRSGKVVSRVVRPS